jgi:hypothetical protein
MTVQLTPCNRGLNYGATSLAVDRGLLEATKIDQEAVVTKCEADPAMAAATHRDLHLISARKSDGLDNVLLIGNLHDKSRAAIGHETIPAHRAETLVVLVGRTGDRTCDARL